MKFYKIDDQIVISDKSLSVGEELVANTTDAAQEKHVPVVTEQDGVVKVQVGSVEHPMLEKHFIEWVAVETDKGFHVRYLEPLQKPEVCISIEGEEVKGVYAYCNLHGLWKAD